METWLPVYGFETSYEISNKGRIRSIRPRNLSQRTLSEEQIHLIYKMHSEGISARKIAPFIGVSQTVISKILKGTAYKSSNNAFLAPAIRTDGYMFVTLSINGVHFHKTIHSMVATAFIGHRPPNRHVNHKNGDKRDNSAENLEYISRKGNSQHSLYELKKAKKLTFEQAKDIWYAKERGETRKKIAEKHNVSVHMVTAIWMGKSWWHAR